MLRDFSPSRPPAADTPEKAEAVPPQGYRITIPAFEGPIDLLLYLIRKNELDIHEVSLADIAKEYLDYVELIKLIDLERAGEFIVIASALMKIKSRSLFAAREDETESPEEEAVRESLIRYLVEYERFGGVAGKLAEKEAERSGVYPRPGEKERRAGASTPRETPPGHGLFDLLTAFRDVLRSAPKVTTHEVEMLAVSPEIKQREIMEVLRRDGKVDFMRLAAGRPRLVIVVTFIAILELIKNRRIRVRQSNQFGTIEIYEYVADEVTDT